MPARKLVITCLLSTLLCVFATAQLPQFNVPDKNDPVDETRPDFCGSVMYENWLRKKGRMATREQIEAWLDVKIGEYKDKYSRTAPPVYKVPTIVHVIHNGQEIGVDENIEDDIIFSQIDLLNEDFRRVLGSRGYNTNAIGADVEIEFCLAIRDTNGNSIVGIDRINGGRVSWDSLSQVDSLQGQTFWPTDKYFNIWVCKFGGALSGYGGYARMAPGPLPGLPTSYNDSIDGVVMKYSQMGSYARYPFPITTGLGRTLTHECGHWLGLWHIWGDGNCSVDDYVSDTPLSDAANFGCPTGHTSCGSTDLIENYMDYTSDGCINMFSADQVTRMRTILTGSASKSPLITAGTCDPLTDDAGLTRLEEPTKFLCDSLVLPTVTLYNYGAATLTSVDVKYRIDGGSIVTLSWSGSMVYDDSTTIVLNPVGVSNGSHSIEVWTEAPNGNSDANTVNDTISFDFFWSDGFAPPYLETFDGATFPPAGWEQYNEDTTLHWVPTTVTGSGCASTQAAFLDTDMGDPLSLVNYDGLISPLIDLRDADSANLIFDLAAASTAFTASDLLMIRVSPFCGICEVQDWDTLYLKYYQLIPTTATYYPNGGFTPGCSDWRSDTVDLTSYAGQKVRIDFRASKIIGSRMYIDNVEVQSFKSAQPQIAFLTDTSYCNEGDADKNAASGDCRPYQDVSLQLRMLNAPTGDATVNFNVISSASDTIDYEILTANPITFLSGQADDKAIVVRVYNDDAVEGLEKLNFSFTISGSTNAVKGPKDTTHALFIVDDDAHPTPGGRDTLLFEDFEGSYANWSKDITAASWNTWYVGTVPALTNNSAYISENSGSTHTYKANFINTTWRYTSLNTSGAPNPGIQFDYICDGDEFDYGHLQYRYNTALDPWEYFGTKLYNQATAGTYDVALPEATLNRDIQLSFTWTNNGVTQTGAPLAVDNVLVYSDTYQKVETQISNYTSYLGPNDTIYFYNPVDGDLMVRLVNTSNWDYGCANLQIERVGNGASQFQSTDQSYDVTDKAFRIDMENDNAAGTYEITLYYTESEISGWETATGQARGSLEIIKTDSTVLSVTPASPEIGSTVCAAAALAAFGDTSWAVSSTFTNGFSGFTCGVCAGLLDASGIVLTGKKGEGVAELKWTASNLTGNVNYQIMHALPGGNFNRIGDVSGNGSGTFEFAHLNPATGLNRYRVDAIDGNSQTILSNVYLIKFETQGSHIISLYPNPGNGDFELVWNSETEESLIFSLVDAKGRFLMQESRSSVAGNNSSNFHFDLPGGIYFLKVRGSDWSEVRKLVIK